MAISYIFNLLVMVPLKKNNHLEVCMVLLLCTIQKLSLSCQQLVVVYFTGKPKYCQTSDFSIAGEFSISIPSDIGFL